MNVRKQLSLAALMIAFVACGPVDDVAGGENCAGGKCDGISSVFRDFYSSMRQVDLGDLVNVGAGFATRQLNDQLDNSEYVSIKLSETELYGTAAQAGNDLTIHDLDNLTAGLASRYGDQAFVTRVNRLRLSHLQSHPGHVFAEAHFRLEGRLSQSFPFEAGGFDGYLGFSGAQAIETQIIAPFTTDIKASLNAPLRVLKAARGFMVPRDVQDVRQMTQGETLTMRSPGRVGFNIGVGIPFYLTTIADVATLHAVFSAGARVSLAGELDIQLIRDEGNVALVDVGVTGQTEHQLSVGIETRWGIEGLPEVTLDVGVLDFNLTDLAEKALTSRLNKALRVFSASASERESETRHTVARFSFDLSRGDRALEQAFTQAMRGDIRLAQSLAQRPNTGVRQLLDLTRDARDISSFLGVEFLGMKFYREKRDLRGSVVVTTDGQSQNLLFDEIDRESGFFFTDRAYNRRSVVSLVSQDGVLRGADFNLRVQLREKDSFTERDQILDHVDHLLALFVGQDAFVSQLAPQTNALERYMDNTCQTPDPGDHEAEFDFRRCLRDLPQSATAMRYKQTARAQLERLLSTGFVGGFSDQFDNAATFIRRLFDLKLEVQGGAEYPGYWMGPSSRMLVEYRLSSRALDSLLLSAQGEQTFVQALRDTLYHLYIRRGSRAEYAAERVAEKLADSQDDSRALYATFRRARAEYQRLQRLGVVRHESRELGNVTLGNAAHLVIVTGRDAEVKTIAEAKAEVATKMFDQMIEDADELSGTAHEIVGYSLLRCVQPSDIELLVDMNFEDGDYAHFPSTRLYGRGATAPLIDAGQFDLEALIRGN